MKAKSAFLSGSYQISNPFQSILELQANYKPMHVTSDDFKQGNLVQGLGIAYNHSLPVNLCPMQLF
jgi:hypothetical protein